MRTFVPYITLLLIIPSASHCDLYDSGERDRSGANDNKEGDYIPWDKLEEFFKTNL